MQLNQRLAAFDQAHADALRRIWFVGDVHGEFKYLVRSLQAVYVQPAWLVFAGDVDIDRQPFRTLLEPLKRWNGDMQVAFVHGNHDADTHTHWAMLHDCGDAVPLHGRVVDMSGVRVAGLGGHFIGRAWKPPLPAHYSSRAAAMKRVGKTHRGEPANPEWNSAIFPEDVDRLGRLRADILLTHEAPSCHPYGFEVLDGLARSLQVQRAFHGHHHDDRTQEYARQREQLGFDAVALQYCAIKNGLGEVVFSGEEGW